jgi:hypothetical protein
VGTFTWPLTQDDDSDPDRTLDGVAVHSINPDLTSGLDLTRAQRLRENVGVAFMGDIKNGPFEVTREVAESLLLSPNPDGRSNRDVVRPWVNGLDLTRRPRDLWIIDFGLDMPLPEAALYEAPFEYVRTHVRPMRQDARQPCCRDRWWIHHNRRPEMSSAIKYLARFAATPRLAKHRLFAWISRETLPDSQVIVIARDDDYTFGVLHSRVHELWALATGTQLETRPRYTPTTCFETFPFPRPTDEQCEAIAAAARELVRLRDGWLDPPGLEPEDLADVPVPRHCENLPREHRSLPSNRMKRGGHSR